MMLTALGIDIMLPSFAELRTHFGLGPGSTATSQVITFFFMGQISQVVFGTLSDRFGRLAILRIGFPLYIAGGLAAAFSPNLTLMLAARFVAGMGSSAVFMATIAGVRDRFKGDQMAQTMSLILTIFLFTPILAPFLGMAILSLSNWRMVFLTPPIFAIGVFLWSLRLRESLAPEKRRMLGWTGIKCSIQEVITNKTFLRYTLITTILFSVFSSYIASSEHIIGEIYNSPGLFIWIFAGIGLLMSICSYFNSKLTVRFGARSTLNTLTLIYTGAALILLIITQLQGNPPNMLVFFVFIAILTALNVTIEPNSSALAMEPMGEVAGMASSVYGTTFFFIGAALGSIISYFLSVSVTPLAVGYVVCGLISSILAFSYRKDPPNSQA